MFQGKCAASTIRAEDPEDTQGMFHKNVSTYYSSTLTFYQVRGNTSDGMMKHLAPGKTGEITVP
jgi:hypothetical protein